METKERMKAILAELGISEGAFEEKCNLAKGFVSKIGDTIRVKSQEKIKEKYPQINLTWLITGEGDMFNNSQTFKTPSKGKTIKYYYDVDASMGNIEFLNDPSQKYKDIIIPGYSDCKYAINAYGDSMHPLIKSGQIILLDDWRESFIAWGKIYLIVTRGGFRAIKYLFPSENNDMVKCVSENKEQNPPFDVPKEDLKLFIVKGWICRDEM